MTVHIPVGEENGSATALIVLYELTMNRQPTTTVLRGQQMVVTLGHFDGQPSPQSWKEPPRLANELTVKQRGHHK